MRHQNLCIAVVFFLISAEAADDNKTKSCELNESLLGEIVKSVALDGKTPSQGIFEILLPKGPSFKGKNDCDKKATENLYKNASLGASLRVNTCTDVKYSLKDFKKTNDKSCFRIEKINIYDTYTLGKKDTLKSTPEIVLDACLEKIGPDKWQTTRKTSENPIYINNNPGMPNPTLTSDVEVFEISKTTQSCVPLLKSKLALNEHRCTISIDNCKKGWAASIEKMSSEADLVKFSNQNDYLTCRATTFQNFGPGRNPNDRYDPDMTYAKAELLDIQNQIRYCNEVYGDLRKLDWFKKSYLDNSSSDYKKIDCAKEQCATR